MRRDRGFSLIEMAAVLGLVGVIGVVVMNVTDNAVKSQKKITAKMDIHSDIVALENVLSNMISTLDMRMTFTGPGLPLTTSTHESRFLIPLSGQCRDLATANCNLDTSLMYVDHKTKNNPAVDAVCNFNAPHSSFPGPPPFPTPNNYKIFVFNGLRTTYGATVINPGAKKITTAGADLNKPGDINLDDGDIFTVFDGSSGSLWRVVKGLAHLNIPTNPLPLMFFRFAITNECYDRLNPPNSQVYYLYAAPLKPNHLLTNYATDLPTDVLKLYNTSVMSIGRKEPEKTFGINKCKWDAGSQKITCLEETKFPKLNKVEITRMDEEFKFALSPSTIIQWYNLGPACSNPALCNIGEEAALPMATVPPGLGRQTVPLKREMKDVPSLLGNGFSFHKQEYLNRIRFRLKQENKRRDVYIRFF